jgi:hypothetical protein
MENDLMTIRYSSIVGGGGSQGFRLDIGSSGNTTFVFDKPQPAGSYSISSQLGDATLDFYAIAQDGTLAGFTNTKSFIATKDFDIIVVYGAATNDLIEFEFKATISPSASGDQNSGVAPFLTSATPATLESIDDTTTVTGGNFATDVDVKFVGQDAVDRPAKSIVRSSSTQLIVTRPDSFPVAQEPYSMIATNPGITDPSTNVNKLTDYFDAGGGVTWVTSATLPIAEMGIAYSVTLEATDADETSVGYTLTSGSLPTGLSLNGSTGVISGTPTVNGTQVFTVTATDAGGNSSSREFTLVVAPPLTVDYLVIAGGGAGGTRDNYSGGGGGAGGYRSSVSGENSGGGSSAESPLTLSPGSNYSVTVGGGGSDSTFSTITSSAGGGGRGVNGGGTGGSGGGGDGEVTAGFAGTTGQGRAGGNGRAGGSADRGGGGGGGASAVGNNAVAGNGGNGGAGVASSITGTSVTRGGGGGGGTRQNTPGSGGAGGGGNGSSGAVATSGAANTGGGGGGAGNASSGNGLGGSGVVIIKYPDSYTIGGGSGLTFSTTTSGSDKITTFTAGTGSISFS